MGTAAQMAWTPPVVPTVSGDCSTRKSGSDAAFDKMCDSCRSSVAIISWPGSKYKNLRSLSLCLYFFTHCLLLWLALSLIHVLVPAYLSQLLPPCLPSWYLPTANAFVHSEQPIRRETFSNSHHIPLNRDYDWNFKSVLKTYFFLEYLVQRTSALLSIFILHLRTLFVLAIGWSLCWLFSYGQHPVTCTDFSHSAVTPWHLQALKKSLSLLKFCF